MSKIKLIFIMIAAFVLLFANSLPAGTIQLPQTGQTKCYDTTGTEINCTGTGQDGEIRAGVVWPEPRFTVTYCDTNGPCSDQSTDCDGNPSTDVITDNLTGLIWIRDGSLSGTRDWYQSIDYANNFSLCGYSDWRLPNINEIESLLNAEEQYPSTWLNNQGFIKVQYNWYWSSTTRAATVSIPSTDSAWVISMMVGWISTNTKVGGHFYSLPVRAGQISIPDFNYPANIWRTGQTESYYPGDDGDILAGVPWPSDRFTANSDGTTITDNLTGLIWTKDAKLFSTGICTVGNRSWQDALDYVKCLNMSKYLGYEDWRLPNRKELYSLYDYSQYYPALPAGNPFLNLQFEGNDDHWSSTTVGAYPYGQTIAWLFRLTSEGGVGGSWKDNRFNYNYSIWPVRGGLTRFKLSFPLSDYTPYNAPISSVFDHSAQGSYSEDRVVISYSGEIGNNKTMNQKCDCYSKVDGQPFIVNGNYTGASSCGGNRYLCYDGHPGIDFSIPNNTPIYATADGVAHLPKSFPGVKNARKFNTVEIDHENGYKTFYLHMNNILVSEGKPIKRGEQIGYSGDFGSRGAFHLHFEVHKDGIPVDPYGWEGEYPDPYVRAVNNNLWN